MKDSEKKMIIILIVIAVVVIGGLQIFAHLKGNKDASGANEAVAGGESNTQNESVQGGQVGGDNVAEVEEQEGGKQGGQVGGTTPTPQTNQNRKMEQTLTEVQKVEWAEITQVQFKEDSEGTTIQATIKNTTNEKQEGFNVNMKLEDKDGKEIVELPGYIPAFEAGESQTIEINRNDGKMLTDAEKCTITKQ